MKIKISFIIILFAALLISAVSCSKTESGEDMVDLSSFVRIHLADYQTAGDEITGENDLQDLRACLFENGRMTAVYDHLVGRTGGYGLQLDRNSGTLYVLTNTVDILDLDRLCDAGISEQEWLSLSAGVKNGYPIRFFSGSTVLSGAKEHNIILSRGFARFDLHIRTVGYTEIETITLHGSSLNTGLFPVAGENFYDSRGDIVFRPDSPYTRDTPGVAYVYEQENSDAVLRAEAIINGKRCELEAPLPEKISRNHIYIVTVVKDVVDQDAQLKVEPWEEGDDVGLYPDWDRQIVVDREKSELPSGAVLSDDGTELTLPYGKLDFVLALDCNDELEISPVDGDSRLSIEPVNTEDGIDGLNIFRVRKPLYTPGVPDHDMELVFKRKGLSDIYPEDRIMLHLSSNPVRLEGELLFDPETYVCDFGRYIDNELGRFIIPADKELLVEFAEGEDPWIKLEPSIEDENIIRVLGGWRPNDPSADGRLQSATLVIRNVADGAAREKYVVSRRNYGLPVTWMHGVWWCKYNARGNSRSFDDQILSASDPAAEAGKSVLDYLRDCSPTEFYDLWGWAYQGDSGTGMRVVYDNGTLVMDGFSTNVSAHINKLPADALAPDGYELPTMEEFNRVFDATDYIWMMWSGTHTLRTPWEGHAQIKRDQRRRHDISVGSVQMSDIFYVGMWSPDFPEYEPITWYGPGAQWNADGIKHANHYNNILFGVHSPEGSGWYVAGNMSALYMQKNGAGNKDTRVLRFKKSPVEYIY